MAIRELFARFEFAWDQGVLGKITSASQRAEAKIRGVGKAFDRSSVAARAGAAPLQALTAETRQVSAATAQLLPPTRLLSSTYHPPAWLTGIKRGVDSLRVGLGGLGSQWRTAFAGGQAARARAQLKRVETGAASATAATRGLKGAMSDTLAAFGVFGGVFGAVFAGGAIMRSVKNTFAQVDATAKLSKQLGVSVEAMQSLEAAANLSGLSIEDLRTGVTTMTRNLGLFAATGEGRAVKILEEMGLGIDEIKGRNPDQLFWEFGKSIAAIEDPVKRSAFAQRIFGESGSRMLALFKGSAEEIDALKKRTEELGVVFSSEFAASIEKTNDEMYLAGLQFQRVKVSMIGALAPSLMWVAGRLIHLGQAFARVTGSSSILQSSFLAGGWMLFAKLLGRLFGGVGGIRGALAKMMPWLIKIGRVLLPWIAWALILDDIITFLRGGDSALGRFLDTLFGAGTAKAVLEDLRGKWAGIVEWLGKARDSIREWASTTDKSTKQALAAIVGFLLVASTGIGQLIIKIAALSAAWSVQIAKTLAAGLAWTAARVQAMAMTASMAGMATAALAAAAAIGAIWLAWDQGSKLLDEVGGWDGLMYGVESLTSGKGFFEGVDERANEKARSAARKRNRDQLRGEAGTVEREGALGRGVRAAPEPRLRGRGGGASSVQLTDQRQVHVTVGGSAQPAETGRAVAAAVVRTQGADARGVRAALVGAGRD